MRRILFVCMGNICRSPTAEGVTRRLLQEQGLAEEVRVDSAGTHDYHVGEAPDPRTREAALKRGVDLSELRARKVHPDDFEKFDLLLAMDRHNLAQLQRFCPLPYRRKLDLFMRYAAHFDVEEVPDPYYGGGRGFELVLDMVEDAARGLIEEIRRRR